MKFNTQFCGDSLLSAADRAPAQNVRYRPRWEAASSLKCPKRSEFDPELGSNFLRMKNVAHAVRAFGQIVHDRGR